MVWEIEKQKKITVVKEGQRLQKEVDHSENIC